MGTIEVDDTPADSVISIRGKPPEMREYLISPSYRMDLITRGDERTEIFVPLNRYDIGTVIGEGGANIQHLSYIAQCDLKVEWNMQGPNGEIMLRIAGAMGDVHTTHKYLLRFLQSKHISHKVTKNYFSNLNQRPK